MAKKLIRLIRRFFPKHRPITITGIMLRSMGDGPVYVDAEINGEWVTVIREHYVDGGVLSHIVEPLGMRCASDRSASRENTNES